MYVHTVIAQGYFVQRLTQNRGIYPKHNFLDSVLIAPINWKQFTAQCIKINNTVLCIDQIQNTTGAKGVPFTSCVQRTRTKHVFTAPKRYIKTYWTGHFSRRFPIFKARCKLHSTNTAKGTCVLRWRTSSNSVPQDYYDSNFKKAATFPFAIFIYHNINLVVSVQ
jgi:hypothetical protein